MIKPTELLKDLCMSRVAFRNIREPTSHNSATFTKRGLVNLPASGDIVLLSLASGMRSCLDDKANRAAEGPLHVAGCIQK